MRVVIASTYDFGGGAETSAWNLFNAQRQRGHDVWLAVGAKRSDNPYVVRIPNDASRTLWARLWLGLEYRLSLYLKNVEAKKRVNICIRAVSEPRRWLETELGHEDYNYPGTRRLLELCDSPEILHCFNLHGRYFDLRELPWLSKQVPVILDLRDAWTISGHCAHSFDCDRWKTGCGHCPDLDIYPKIPRDATSYNWQRKRDLYRKSRLYVSTPCHWLMQRVKDSILSQSIVEARVIPTGIDLTVFQRGDKSSARTALNLPQDARILLFTANGIRRNMWKDYKTLKSAVEYVGHRLRHMKILCVALGEESPPEHLGGAEVRFVPFQNNAATVAQYYQAADLYVHAARADTFPRAVLEALSCGTPVVATAVGGIAEQIKGLRDDSSPNAFLNVHEEKKATGVLVAHGDLKAMGLAIEKILTNDRLRRVMSENACRDAEERFNLQDQTDRYLEWYRELLDKKSKDQETPCFVE